MKSTHSRTNCFFMLSILLVISTFVIPTIATSQQPRPLTGVLFSGTALRDTTTGIFTYGYKLVNPASNQLDIYRIDIDLTRSPDQIILSAQGLVNGPRYGRHGSEYTLQRVPTVPIGITGPQGWIYDIGETAGASQSYASWGPLEETFLVRPGNSLQGFDIKSYGLPGLREVRVYPWVLDYVPPDLTEWEQLDAFYSQFTFRTKTIGPVAPKINFVAIDFLNYLISLAHESFNLGWLKNAGTQQSLLAKLTNAKRQLENGNNTPAKNMIGAFLNELSGASCQELSCPNNKPLTSEAYALLFFNGQYLYDRL